MCFEKTIEQYGKMVRCSAACHPAWPRLLVAAGTLARRTIYPSTSLFPKGVLSRTGYEGCILGVSQAPETVSFSAMSKLQQQLVQVIRQDAAVENLTSFIGADGVNTTMNSGRIQITR